MEKCLLLVPHINSRALKHAYTRKHTLIHTHLPRMRVHALPNTHAHRTNVNSNACEDVHKHVHIHVRFTEKVKLKFWRFFHDCPCTRIEIRRILPYYRDIHIYHS